MAAGRDFIELCVRKLELCRAREGETVAILSPR
jgi:hypothetical protein